MFLVVFCLGLPEAQAIVVFSDGGVHTIDTYLGDYVDVLNNPLGWPTTLNLVTGGQIQWLRVYDSSLANISGGSVYYHNSVAAAEGLAGFETAGNTQLYISIFVDGTQKSCLIKEAKNCRNYRAIHIGLKDILAH